MHTHMEHEALDTRSEPHETSPFQPYETQYPSHACVCERRRRRRKKRF